MVKKAVLGILFLSSLTAYSQSSEYQVKKAEKIKEPSPFEAIISGTKRDQIIYENEYVVAFVPLRKQAPIHILIVPKNRVYTLNDIKPGDETLLAQLLLVAKELAKKNGIDQSGYRISINTNEDAGQSVFHLHVHLLGGMPLGPMVTQSYEEKK